MKLLLLAGAAWDIQDNDGRTPLHWSAALSSAKCTLTILKALDGVPDDTINYGDKDGMTALVCAPPPSRAPVLCVHRSRRPLSNLE